MQYMKKATYNNDVRHRLNLLPIQPATACVIGQSEDRGL